MNTALVYRPSRRWLVWAAFACATGIHIAAIVVAQGKSDKSAAQDFKPAGVDLEIVDKGPEETPPEDVAMPPPPEQVPPDLEAFPEENRTPPPVRPRKKTRVASFVRSTAAPLGGVRALVTYAPRPVYPYRGATSANNRVGYRAADGRFGRRQRGRCSYGAELRKCDS